MTTDPRTKEARARQELTAAARSVTSLGVDRFALGPGEAGVWPAASKAMMVATMISAPSAKPAGFLDLGIRSVLSPLLETVQGQGCGQWFLNMAFLQPIAWMVSKFGGVHQLRKELPV